MPLSRRALLLLLLVPAAFAAEPRLIFSDDFTRDTPGEAWHPVKGTWEIKDGALVGTEIPADQHGAVTQTYLDFSDLVLAFRFQFRGSSSFNVVIDDRHYRGSHAGHICRLAISKGAIRLGDDKTGIMENTIFAMRRDPARKAEAGKLIEGKQKTFPVNLEDGGWHSLRVSLTGETLAVQLDGKDLGSLTSPGIGHLTKTDFGFTVNGPAVLLDEVEAWLPPATGETWIYGASAETRELVAVRHQRKADGDSFEIVQRLPLDIAAGPMAWHPDHRLIYVADTKPKADGGARGHVYPVGADGHLGTGRTVAFDHGYAYLSLDRGRRFLLGASYREGHLDVYKLDGEGLPGGRVSTRFEGRDKAHAILASPDNRHVYVPHVKDRNALYQYAFEARTGVLTPLKTASLEPPHGSGPRHLAFHPSRPFVFFSNEQHVGASSYRRGKNGELSFLQLCEVFDTPPATRQSASDIALTRGGRFLFTGLRGPKDGLNGVNRYAVGDDGLLRFLGRTPTGAIPWCLQLSPDEQRLFVTAATEGTLESFAVGPGGELSKTGEIAWGKGFRDLVVIDVR